VGTNDRTASRNVAEPEVPRRRWGRALLWIGLIGLLVVGAIAASLVFDDNLSPDELMGEPPVDTDVFCQTAARFSSFDHLDMASGGADQLAALAAVATQLGSLSPKTIDDDFSAVSDALNNVSGAVNAIPDDDPAGLAVVTQKLDDELGAVSQQADQAAAYIERWCGPLDTLGTSIPTQPDGATSDPSTPDSSTPDPSMPGSSLPGPGGDQPSG
jgi:hypothetical protein